METKKLSISEVVLFMDKPCMVYSNLTGSFRKETITTHLLNLCDRRPDDFIRPILRPRNDITNEELAVIKEITSGYSRPNSPVCQYQIFKYLLSIGLDLFDWIPDGLAIDQNNLIKGRRYYEK